MDLFSIFQIDKAVGIGFLSMDKCPAVGTFFGDLTMLKSPISLSRWTRIQPLLFIHGGNTHPQKWRWKPDKMGESKNWNWKCQLKTMEIRFWHILTATTYSNYTSQNGHMINNHRAMTLQPMGVPFMNSETDDPAPWTPLPIGLCILLGKSACPAVPRGSKVQGQSSGSWIRLLWEF